jgi:ankyrin repeat protein
MDWISSNSHFLNWSACLGTGVLHIYGPPGSGTTMSSSHIVKLLKSDPLNKDAAFISFSFDRQDIQSCQEKSLFLSLSRQLLSDRPSLFQQTSSLCSWLMGQSILTRESLWALFRSLLTSAFRGPTFCIISSVDECESWQTLIRDLADLETSEQIPLKFLLTSGRPLDTALNCGPNRYFLISMSEEKEMALAIHQSVNNRLARLVQVKPVWKGFEDQVVGRLDLAGSTYFLAMQQMNYLESPTIRSSKATVRDKLSNLPTSLPEVYGCVLKPISTEQRNWAVLALSWIVHALRPLKQCELAVALALEDKEIRSLESLTENISWDIMGDINQLIGPLIKFSDGRLYPIHRTVRTQEDLSEEPAKFHAVMLSTCLHYLSIMGKSRELSQTSGDYSQVACSSNAEFGLLHYAVLYWPEHYRQAELNSAPGLDVKATTHSRLTEDVFNFLIDANLIQTWFNMYSILDQAAADQHVAFENLLNVASRFGLLGVVEKSLDLEYSSVSADDLRVALNLAAQHGHTEIVKRLLARGAASDHALGLAAGGGYVDVMNELFSVTDNLEKPDARACTPLLQAAIGGHLNATLKLLDRGASPNSTSLDGSTAVHFAARIGQIVAVEGLMKAGADQNACNLAGVAPLHFAAEGGFADVVALLLKYDAPVGKKTVNGDTPLHLAVTSGHLSTCQILLRFKANPTSPNNFGLTPLHLASREGYLPIVKLLFDRGASAGSHCLPGDAADIEDLSLAPTPPTSNGKSGNVVISPLQLAAQNGHVDVLQALLSQRMETKVDNGDSQPNRGNLVDQEDIDLALLAAAEAGHLSVVKQLIGRNIGHPGTDAMGNTALHLAAMANHSDVVTELVKSFMVDTTNNEGLTPLHLVAESGNVGMARLLIYHHAQVTMKTNTGDNPLHLAAKRGHVSVVRVLQAARNTSSMLNNEGRTAISLAVRNGQIGVVKELLEGQHKDSRGDRQSDPDLLHEVVRIGSEAILQTLLESGFSCDTVNTEGDKPIHVAAREGHSTVIGVLIKSGADVNARNGYGRTPLILAAENGKVAACEVLLEAKAEIDAKNSDDETALFRASTRGFPKVVEMLLKWHADANMANSKGWTALHAAMDSVDRVAIIKLLLECKADPNLQNDYGSTPIVLAAQDGRTDAVHLLLQSGADVKVRSSSGSTSLHRAARDGHLDTVKLLVEEGAADCNYKKSDGSTALYMAARYGHTSTVRYLIRHTEDIDGQDTECGSPLAAAAMVQNANKDGHLNTAKLLISKGADINARGGPYCSALQAAACFESIEMVQLLLYNKADVNSTGGSFGTALNAAIERERLDIIEILLENKADPNIRFSGYTALKFAIDCANLSIVEMLLKYGANPDLPIQANDTALHAAARGDLLEIFKALVAGNANLKSNDVVKEPILTDAIAWYSPSVVEYLLSIDIIDINEKDSMSRSPLLFSILLETGDVEELLNAGADPDTTDSEGKTPLIHAIMMDDEGLATTLLKKKASPSIRDAFGRGPLYWACYFGNEDLFETILKALEGHPDRETNCNLAIHAAAAKNKPEFLTKLLEEEEADPNQRDRSGWTPLFTARCYGFEVVETQLIAAVITKPILQRQPSYNVASSQSRDTSSRSRRRRRRSPEPRSPVPHTEDLSLELPSEWDPRDKSPLLKISDSGLKVTVGGRCFCNFVPT